MRLRPVRCERVHPAHGWVNQSPAEPQSLTELQMIVNERSRTTVKTRSLAAASTTGMKFLLLCPRRSLSVQVSDVTGPQTGLTKPQRGGRRREKNPHCPEDICIPKLLIRNFSYVAPVCDPSDIEANVLSDSLSL